MSDPITDALARANAVPQAVPTTSPSTAVAQTNPERGRPRSLADAVATAGTSVDNWIGVKEGSFTLDKNKIKDEEILVTIKLSEIKFGFGVRYNLSGRPTYAKSYDGVTESRSGKSWASVINEATRIDAACRGSYDLADVPMILRQDLASGGKEPSSASEGDRAGYTTSVTGYGVLMSWVNEALVEFGADKEIPVKLTLREKKGPTGPYAVMDFQTDRS